MKAVEVARKFGGISKLRKIVDDISSERGVFMFVTPFVSEEDKKDNWMGVMFKTNDEITDSFNRALGDMEFQCVERELYLEYDGKEEAENGEVMFYRIKEFIA